ncbi:MAG TPA: hypothetical protein VNC21_08205 [Vicinamibacterales bacterium]|nr:hypothetical protein [Vicinamibacterales bacterium]
MRRVALCIALVILPVALRATVIVPIEFRELVTIAPVIVHGRVVDVRSGWVDGRRSVETFVTIEATEYLKGDLGERVTFKVPGGQLGRYRTVFIGAPAFEEGDEVVLFLKGSESSYPYIIGLSQGAFRVVVDARSGRRMVTTPVVMGKGGDDPQPIVRGDATRKPMPIAAFREAVRLVISQGAGQ